MMTSEESKLGEILIRLRLARPGSEFAQARRVIEELEASGMFLAHFAQKLRHSDG